MQTLNQVADAGENLLTLPITLRQREQRDLIQERFEVFHRAHPEIYVLLVFISREGKAEGKTKWGMKAVFEIARWKMRKDKSFILNNDFTALYARLIMSQEPDLAGFFETRERIHETNH